MAFPDHFTLLPQRIAHVDSCEERLCSEREEPLVVDLPQVRDKKKAPRPTRGKAINERDGSTHTRVFEHAAWGTTLN
jgi:hypothetical protein